MPKRSQQRTASWWRRQISKLSVLFSSPFPKHSNLRLRELFGHKSVLHVANNSQSYMTDKIIWRRSFPNHFLIQHADRSDTCVVQNCHNLRRGDIRQTRCDLGLIWRNLNASLDLSSSRKDWSGWFLLHFSVQHGYWRQPVKGWNTTSSESAAAILRLSNKQLSTISSD